MKSQEPKILLKKAEKIQSPLHRVRETISGISLKTTVPSIRASEKYYNDAKKKASAKVSMISHRIHKSVPAQKLAPGTRTRMLKIIYDNKKSLSEKRQKSTFVKALLAGVFIIAAIIFLSGMVNYITQGTWHEYYKSIGKQWFEKVDALPVINTSVKAAAPARSAMVLKKANISSKNIQTNVRKVEVSKKRNVATRKKNLRTSN